MFAFVQWFKMSDRTPNTSKWKIKCISIEEKYVALKTIDAGESQIKRAVELVIGTSTVDEREKYQKDIEKWCLFRISPSGKSDNVKRKLKKGGKHPNVSKALYVWFTQKREQEISGVGCNINRKSVHVLQWVGRCQWNARRAIFG